MKSSGNHRFSDDFRGNWSQLIPLNSLNIRSKIWWRGKCNITIYFFFHPNKTSHFESEDFFQITRNASNIYESLLETFFKVFTKWKMSKYGVISGLYFPIFSPNTGKYGPEIIRYLDTFHVVIDLFLPNISILHSLKTWGGFTWVVFREYWLWTLARNKLQWKNGPNNLNKNIETTGIKGAYQQENPKYKIFFQIIRNQIVRRNTTLHIFIWEMIQFCHIINRKDVPFD